MTAKTWIRIASVLACSLVCVESRAPIEADAMLDAARKFLATLSSEQLDKAKKPFDSASRTAWAYTPAVRVGIRLSQFTESQRTAAFALLRSSLSVAGFEKAEQVRILEGVLREFEGPNRDPENYVFTFFGEPAEHGLWAWRYEGHHLSLNFTVRDGTVIATTPEFFGSNPAEVQEGSHKGLRPLAKEEDLARDLVRSLGAEERRKAVVSDRAPADIVTSNQRKAVAQGEAGILYSELDEAHQRTLWELIRVHADAQAPKQATARLNAVKKGGLEKVRFAWMGGLEPGQGHYYRIQGPTFLVEFDNTQNRANHIHSVWRDFKGDFGGEDVLAEHYANSPPHRYTR